ncbi:hypothetical protein TNIN_494151, partial [Trichonephila inaurata madagascariensis]
MSFANSPPVALECDTCKHISGFQSPHVGGDEEIGVSVQISTSLSHCGSTCKVIDC